MHLLFRSLFRFYAMHVITLSNLVLYICFDNKIRRIDRRDTFFAVLMPGLLLVLVYTMPTGGAYWSHFSRDRATLYI